MKCLLSAIILAAAFMACVHQSESFIVEMPGALNHLVNDTCMYRHEKLWIGISDITNVVATQLVACPPSLLTGYEALEFVDPFVFFEDIIHSVGHLIEDTNSMLWNDIPLGALPTADLGPAAGPLSFCLNCYQEVLFTDAGATEWFTFDCKDITCPDEFQGQIHYNPPGTEERELQATYCHYTHDDKAASYFLCRVYSALNEP